MNNNNFLSVLDQNKKNIFIGLGAVILAVLVVGLWQDQKSRKNEQATNALYDIQIQARELVAQKKFAEAEKAFDPIFEKYNGSRAAFEARLQIGDILMDQKNYSEASKRYEQAAALASDTFSKVLAQYSVGIARESAGQFQEAINGYEEALKNQGSEFLRPEILMAQGRCYESMNQNEKAIAVYKMVEEKYPNRTYYSGAASAYEKQLKAKKI